MEVENTINLNLNQFFYFTLFLLLFNLILTLKLCSLDIYLFIYFPKYLIGDETATDAGTYK